MTFNAMGPRVLDYLPCRYGKSRLLFRGPRRKLDKSYAAFLGGTETYGKFINAPFASLVERETGLMSVNFGCPNAGIDAFAMDPFVPGAAAEARITVVQVMGAQNMTNRFYAVHPRRNDRFLAPSDLLKTIFREIDFSEFHFNKHLLSGLLRVSPERFETVRRELQSAWVARMKGLFAQMRGRIILLWFADHPPPPGPVTFDSLGRDPLFVTRDMIEELAPHVTKVVVVVPSARAVAQGTEGMIFSPLESHAAERLPGVLAHEEAAAALVQAMSDMV